MKLRVLVDQLKSGLKNPLPGNEAQLAQFSQQALSDYKKRFELGSDQPSTRQSSVMILLYEKEGQVYIPLIKRPEYEGVHSGQIALPGGKAEPDDQDIVATALRETWEEIGIVSDQIEILRTLTAVFIPPSRFWVNVVLGYSDSTPQFVLDTREVASLIELPLDHLTDNSHIEERTVNGSTNWKMKAPGYTYQDHFIWGATFMILTEFRELIKSAQTTESNF